MLLGEKGEYTLLIREDTDAQSPREDEPFGKMICFHSRYNLGDEHNYADKDDFLRDLYLDTVGNNEQGERRYERLLDRFDTPEHGGYGSGQYQRAVDNALLEAISEKHVILPLHLYDHSMLSISAHSFVGRAHHAEWDSGQVGWVYADKDDILKEFGGKNLTPDKREKAETLLHGEVETYDCYLRGECYGFELLQNGKMVDSCWGFLGGMDQVLEAMKEHLPDDCAGITENMAEVEERVSVLDFLKTARSKIADAPAAPRREAIETAVR